MKAIPWPVSAGVCPRRPESYFLSVLLILSFTSTGCHATDSANSTVLATEGQQGIKGKVIQCYSIGREVQQGIVETVEERPCAVNVYVFKGKVTSQKESEGNLLGTIKSAIDGGYTVALEPGEYTLAAGIDNDSKNIFRNEKWETVTVKTKEWIEQNMVNRNTGK